MADAGPRTAHVKENGNSAFAVDILVSNHRLCGDEPREAGGGNTAPAPYDFLATALGTCTVMTMRWYARQKNLPLEHAEAFITHEKRDGKDHFVKKLVVKGAALTDEQRAKLLDVAAKCPVHRTLTSDITIETQWND